MSIAFYIGALAMLLVIIIALCGISIVIGLVIGLLWGIFNGVKNYFKALGKMFSKRNTI